MVDHSNVAKTRMSKIDTGLAKNSGVLRYAQAKKLSGIGYPNSNMLADLIFELHISYHLLIGHASASQK